METEEIKINQRKEQGEDTEAGKFKIVSFLRNELVLPIWDLTCVDHAWGKLEYCKPTNILGQEQDNNQ